MRFIIPHFKVFVILTEVFFHKEARSPQVSLGISPMEVFPVSYSVNTQQQ